MVIDVFDLSHSLFLWMRVGCEQSQEVRSFVMNCPPPPPPMPVKSGQPHGVQETDMYLLIYNDLPTTALPA